MRRAHLTVAARLYLLIGLAAFALLVVIAAVIVGSGRMVGAGERLHARGVSGIEQAYRLALLFDQQRGLVSRAPALTSDVVSARGVVWSLATAAVALSLLSSLLALLPVLRVGRRGSASLLFFDYVAARYRRDQDGDASSFVAGVAATAPVIRAMTIAVVTTRPRCAISRHPAPPRPSAA